MDYLFYLCERPSTSIGRIRREICSSESSCLKMKFNLSFNSVYFNLEAADEDLVSTECYRISASVEFPQSMSLDGIWAAIDHEIKEHLHLPNNVMERVRGAVRPSDTSLPDYTFCCFDVPIWTTNRPHYHVIQIESDSPHMVPAADSSLGMLDKYEVDCSRETETACCCICLEDVGGGHDEILRMPCLHVFHAGCIKQWLSTSHYCPICRYQMPTEET